MANIDLRFLCNSMEVTDYITVKVFQDVSGTEVIDIVIVNGDKTNMVILDKSTAIKFAKTLRTEINKMGVQNV